MSGMPGKVLLAAAGAVACVSAQNSWSISAQNVATEGTGVSLNADGKTGFFAGGINGVGACVLKTTDGGNTWAQTSDPMELLVLDVTSYTQYVAASATLGAEYSVDGGNTFNASTCDQTPVSQCIRNYGPHDTPLGFAMVGQFGLVTQVDGVAISTNDGATYTSSNITALMTDARYGAFPTANTWYVSAGQWPDSGNDQPSDQPTTGGSTTGGSTTGANGVGMRPVTGKMSVYQDSKKKMYGRSFYTPSTAVPVVSGRSMQVPNGSYAAQIVKSSDGGKTWASQFFNLGLYFNGIDCLDENRCCVAGENDDAAPAGGAFIYCTQDGGAHWNQMYANTNYTGASLLDLRVVGNNGYWAVGGIINGAPEAAVFLYSADAGQTWTVDSVLTGYYATAVDCAVGTQTCLATVLDAAQETSIAVATATSKGSRIETPKEREIRARWTM